MPEINEVPTSAKVSLYFEKGYFRYDKLSLSAQDEELLEFAHAVNSIQEEEPSVITKIVTCELVG